MKSLFSSHELQRLCRDRGLDTDAIAADHDALVQVVYGFERNGY